MQRDEKTEQGKYIVGRNAVLELLKSGRAVDKIYVGENSAEGSVKVIIALAAKAGIPLVTVKKEKLDAMAGGLVHQGVAAAASEKEYCTIDDILEIAREKNEKPFILICDDIEDPHNLGAMIRCAEGAGVHGVIIPKRHGVGITPAVARTSAGAVEHIAVAKVTNISAAIEELKEKGVWIYSADASGQSIYETDLSGACAFVLGNEGRGVGRLIRENSDYIISIPMYGKVNSFNVSTATAVILCEAAKQRHIN